MRYRARYGSKYRKRKIDIIKTALITVFDEEMIIKTAKISKEKLEEKKKEIQ